MSAEREHLYLHETIDVVGQGAYAYMEHLKREPAQRMPGMFRLQGTFYVMGITGRWPRVVNIHDVPGGWHGWGENVERLGMRRRTDFYEQWWDEALPLRSGGFDRLCVGTAGSPTTEEIAARGIRGSLFVHELSEVRPGAQGDYLAAVAEERAPLLAEYGHLATGFYEVVMNDTEVVTVWASDVASHLRLREAHRAARRGEGGDERLTAWHERARQFTTRWPEELMTPCPGLVYSPA